MADIPGCDNCRHVRNDGSCVAFPDGIPMQILAGDIDHREPFPGDNGIQYERADSGDPLDES